MNVGKRALSIFMSLVLAVGLCPALAFAEVGEGLAVASIGVLSDANIASGTWGTCPWEISADGTLMVHPGQGGECGYDDESEEACSYWFEHRSDIRKVVFSEESGEKVILSDASHLLHGLGNVREVELSGLDTSSVEDMSYMFATNDDLHFAALGRGESSLVTLDLASIDSSLTTDMRGMFAGCNALTSINLSGLDTSRVIDMRFMFAGCSQMEALNCDGVVASSARNLGYMFYCCSSLDKVGLSGWDTSNVYELRSMFSNCSSLVSLDLSSFDTSKVVSAGFMFQGDSSLETIFAGDRWTMSHIGQFDNDGGYLYDAVSWGGYDTDVFVGCVRLVGGNGTLFDASHAVTSEYAHVDTDEAPGYFTHVSDAAKTPISSAVIAPVANQEYTSEAVTPTAAVALGGVDLTLGTDYKLKYLNNVNTGTATIVAVGVGGYRGAVRATFTIAPPNGLTAAGKWGTCSWEIDADGALTVGPGIAGSAQSWHYDWGYAATSSYWYGYNGSTTITKVVFEECDGQKAVAPADCSRLFADLNGLRSVDFSGLDTSQVL